MAKACGMERMEHEQISARVQQRRARAHTHKQQLSKEEKERIAEQSAERTMMERKSHWTFVCFEI